jgi:hypothetical protein
MNGWKIEWQSKDGQHAGAGERTFYNKVIAIQVAKEMNHHDPTFEYRVKPVKRGKQEEKP